MAGDTHALYSGTTLHGMQFLDDRRETPTAYYVECRARWATCSTSCTGGCRAPRGYGIVGLGAGGLSTYGRAGDSIRFFESTLP